MSKYHHMQETRKSNLNKIAKFEEVAGKNPKNVDRKKLLRKIMLVIGSTREKSREYMNIVLGDEE